MATLLLLVFGAVMTAVGIFGGLAQLHEQARNWTAARRYVPVPAQVESAFLDSTRGKKSTTYQAKAQFSYEYQDRRYVSNRVSFSNFSDNIGDFQHRLASELRAAMDKGESVTLWLDPLDPASSVYDKSIRPAMVAFHLLFAVLFPSAGLGALYGVIYVLRDGHQKPRTTALIRTKGNGVGLMLFATLHVNSIGWTIAHPAIEQFLSGHQAPATAPLLFPLAGLAMIYFTWRRWRHPRLTGKPVLEITSTAPLRGRLLFHPNQGLQSPSRQPLVQVAIDARQVRERRVNRKLEFETVWQQRVLDRTVPRGTELLEFEAVGPHLGDKQWHLILHLDNRTTTFEIPKDLVCGESFS